MIQAKIKRQLQQEVESECPFCGEKDVSTFQIHHIIATANRGEDSFDNLILLCSNCHNRVERKEINSLEVLKKKLSLKDKNIKQVETKDQKTSSISFKNFMNTGIIGNNVTVKTAKGKLSINPPSGTIGNDARKLNYIKHLIKRYQNFASEQKDRSFHYSVIYKIIYNKYKIEKIELLNENLFYEITKFLQDKIDNTLLGRINKSKDTKNYSSFEDFAK